MIEVTDECRLTCVIVDSCELMLKCPQTAHISAKGYTPS